MLFALNHISFGNSQPLKPLTDETKVVQQPINPIVNNGDSNTDKKDLNGKKQDETSKHRLNFLA